MTYLSNLGQLSNGSNAVGSDSWLAALFYTGANAAGYSLDSVQLGMADASGSPSDFTAMIYGLNSNMIGGVFPGSSLGTLDGSLDPATGDIYTFTAISNLLLSPGRPYFIVLTAETAVADGAYNWSVMNTASYNLTGGWLGAVTLGSTDGLSWAPLPTYPLLDFSQFAINATAIPEPGVLSLLGLGGLALLWHRRKQRQFHESHPHSILLFAVALLFPQLLQAQGTTYISNLGQTSAGSLAVGSDSWQAPGFITGTNAAGYILNSVQLAMTDVSGSPIGFTAMIYWVNSNNFGAVVPGNSLGTLDSSLDPTTSGVYTYSAISNLMLSPQTTYFIVLTSGTAVANGAYEWSYISTSSFVSSDNWGGGFALYSNNGSLWHSSAPTFYSPQFSINATAIPEPGVLSLVGLGGLTFLWLQRKNSPQKNRH